MNGNMDPYDENDTDDEEEEEVEGPGFFEWVSTKVSKSRVAKRAYNTSTKVWAYSKWAGLVGLKVTWVVMSSSLIVGIPLMLAVDGERSVLEMQKQMAAQTGSPLGAIGPGGVPLSAVPGTIPMPALGSPPLN